MKVKTGRPYYAKEQHVKALVEIFHRATKHSRMCYDYIAWMNLDVQPLASGEKVIDAGDVLREALDQFLADIT